MHEESDESEDIISIGPSDLSGGTQTGSPRHMTPSAAKAPPNSHATGRWFVARTSVGDRTVRGPYDEQAIRLMLQQGQLAWQDQASQGSQDPWRPLAAVPAFTQPSQVTTTSVPAAAQTPSAQASAQTSVSINIQQVSPTPAHAPTVYAHPTAATGPRSHVAAGLLALLLGTWGLTSSTTAPGDGAYCTQDGRSS